MHYSWARYPGSAQWFVVTVDPVDTPSHSLCSVSIVGPKGHKPINKAVVLGHAIPGPPEAK